MPPACSASTTPPPSTQRQLAEGSARRLPRKNGTRANDSSAFHENMAAAERGKGEDVGNEKAQRCDGGGAKIGEAHGVFCRREAEHGKARGERPIRDEGNAPRPAAVLRRALQHHRRDRIAEGRGER